MTDPKPKDDLGLNEDIEWFLRDNGNGPSESVKKPDENVSQEHKVSPPSKGLGLSPETSPKPHLNATISNSNDHIVAKTKPSIATIQEEEVLSPVKTPTARKRSSSIGSLPSPGPEKEGGLFSKLKGKFHKSPPNSPVLTAGGGSIFKDNYRLSRSISNTSGDFSLSRTLSNSTNDPKRSSSLHSVKSPSATSIKGTKDDDLDPKLDEYVKFYSQKSNSRPSSRKSSISESSCLLNPLSDDNNTTSQQSSGSKLSSFLRRKSAQSTTALPLVSVATEFNRRSSTAASPQLSAAYDSSEGNSWLSDMQQYKQADSSPAELKPILPEFENLKPLKRVAFHSSTFLIDPPQQIPSRNPRVGNIEVLPSGILKVHPLSEEDKLAIEKSQAGQGGGIVVGGTGALHFLKKEDEEEGEYSHKHKEEAVKEEKDDPQIDNKASKFGIDKPMIHSRPQGYTVPVEKMALDLMYTRCCHLREILPIPAILKQIPKNSMAPLPVLQLRNPTPTMVEIETFADYIRIAPIICISLDGVSLSYEQFKILLSAMSAKTQLLKLSLRNTPIDANGWSLLCWFLSRNTALNKLDITQCPSLTVNNFKKKKKLAEKPKPATPEIVRMSCNKENRSDMDWALFTATIIARGGIEELILTGCCITDLDLFAKLVKLAIGIKTNRLGLAYNRLTTKHLEVLLRHYIFKPFVRGIDFGFNDFSDNSFLNVMKDYQQEQGDNFSRLMANSQIGFLSLHSTNLRYSVLFKAILEQFIIQLPNLKYLDLSNNVKLFNSTDSGASDSEIMDYFCTKFPLFPKLIRLHLEHNNLPPQSVISLANIFPFCRLGYVSLIGNKLDPASAATLIQGVKNSKIITLEADLDEMPSYFKDRLGLYTMRNMEAAIYPKKVDTTNNEELTSQLNEILELKAKQELDLNSPVVKDFLTRAKKMRLELQDAVNELNDLQLSKQLTLEGKEALVRLIFIGSSIGRAIQLVDSSFKPKDLTNEFTFSEHRETDSSTDLDLNGVGSNSSSLSLEENRATIITPARMSRTNSKTSLNQLDKEEGSVHKLNHNLGFTDPEILGIGDVSGEEIRQRIRGVSLKQLDDIVGLVTDLKERGVPISTLFKAMKSEKDHEKDEGIDVGYITERLRKLSNGSTLPDDKKYQGVVTSDTTDRKDEDKSTDPKTDQSNTNTQMMDNGGATPMIMDDSKITNEQGAEVNDLFDQVLHNINTSR